VARRITTALLLLAAIASVMVAFSASAQAPTGAEFRDATNAINASTNDWRAFIITLLFIVLIFAGIIGAMMLSISKERTRMANDMAALHDRQAVERTEMRAVAKEFSAAADKVADAMVGVTTELYALRALTARAEQMAGKPDAG
jgi:hypothetical protein